MANETRTVLDEEWRAAFGGVVAADGSKLLEPLHGGPLDAARAKIAVLGKRALVLLLRASTCPTCANPMTGHAPGCAMGTVLAEVDGESSAGL
jgi:hypothetical protein